MMIEIAAAIAFTVGVFAVMLWSDLIRGNETTVLCLLAAILGITLTIATRKDKRNGSANNGRTMDKR